MSLPKIIDNERKTLLDAVIEVSASHSELSIATGYWDLEAMRLVMPHLGMFENESK